MPPDIKLLRKIGERALEYVRTHGTRIEEKPDYKNVSTGKIILRRLNNG